MGKIINNKLWRDEQKRANLMAHYKVKCEKCGHTLFIPPSKTKVLCNFCGNYKFKTPKDEFSYRFNEFLSRKNRGDNYEKV